MVAEAFLIQPTGLYALKREGAPLKVARVSVGFIGVEDGIHPSHIWTLVPRVGALRRPDRIRHQ